MGGGGGHDCTVQVIEGWKNHVLAAPVGAAQLRAIVIASSSYKGICTKKNLTPCLLVQYSTVPMPSLWVEDHFV